MPLDFKMYSYIGPEPLRINIPLLPPPTRKSTASSSTHTPPPNGLASPPEFANDYQLNIISALRGNDHNFLSRAAVADAIASIDNEQHKLQLIDFLAAEQGAIALTMENNACKAFECTPGELFVIARRMEHAAAATIAESADDESSEQRRQRFGSNNGGENKRELCSRQQGQEQFLTKLIQLFRTTMRKIVPNTFGMLYPLQQFDSNFQIRSIILQQFRDRVLLSLLDNFYFDRAIFKQNPMLERELRQMFMLINFDVRDDDDEQQQSDESECFDQIFTEFLGQNAVNEGDKFDGSPISEKNAEEDNFAPSTDDEEDEEKNVRRMKKTTKMMTKKNGMFAEKTATTTTTTNRRLQRAQRSAPNSLDIDIGNAAEMDASKSTTAKSSFPSAQKQQQQQQQPLPLPRKSFSPSPKLLMPKDVLMAGEREREQIVVGKQRARTMPSKTVTFWDDGEESSTVNM